jgi:Dullard-like phosphatase family protein
MLNHNLCSEIISEEDNYTSQKDQTRNQTNIMESISLTNEKQLEDPVSPTKIIPQKMSNQEKFLCEVSKLDFFPLGCIENISGNYDNYVSITLSHILKMKSLKFNYALESPSLYENFPKNKIERIAKTGKKILLLDLDETLIHADFNEEFLNNETIKYDAIITFYSKINTDEILSNKNNDNDNNNDIELNTTDVESKDDNNSNDKVLNKVGIFLRPGLQNFLVESSKYFEIGIFTASLPEYADAVINYLDPDNKYIKFRLYRNNCINVGDLLRVKDLRILKNINIKNIILLDNNMYSFTPQISNGILINSFYFDKQDKELYNVLNYLIEYILPSSDVRKVNEQFFGFKKILDDIAKNSI